MKFLKTSGVVKYEVSGLHGTIFLNVIYVVQLNAKNMYLSECMASQT